VKNSSSLFLAFGLVIISSLLLSVFFAPAQDNWAAPLAKVLGSPVKNQQAPALPQIKSYYDPTDIEPTDVEPTYIEPTYVDPLLIEPTDVEPTDIEPTYVEPTDIEPTYIEPTDIEPTDIEPFDQSFFDQPAEEPVEWTEEDVQQAEDIAEQLGVDDSAEATAADEIEMYTEKELLGMVSQQRLDESNALYREINALREGRNQQEHIIPDSAEAETARDALINAANEQIQQKITDLQAKLGRILLDDPANFQANYALGQIYRGQGYEGTAQVFYRRGFMNLPNEQQDRMLDYLNKDRSSPWIQIGGENNRDGGEAQDKKWNSEVPGTETKYKNSYEEFEGLQDQIELDNLFNPDHNRAAYIVGPTKNPKAYSGELLSRAMAMSPRFSNYVAERDVFGINKPKVGQ